jgi:hypothetical protein
LSSSLPSGPEPARRPQHRPHFILSDRAFSAYFRLAIVASQTPVGTGALGGLDPPLEVVLPSGTRASSLVGPETI